MAVNNTEKKVAQGNVLTMVARFGDPKAPPEAAQYTLVDENYSLVSMTGTAVVKAIASKSLTITNMEVTDKGLNSSNGALKNYTTFDQGGNLINEPRCVILNRIEDDKGLRGYTIFNVNGILQEVNTKQAAALAVENKIANGKIRHTQQGDIVASIGGVYPLCKVSISKPKKSEESTLTVGIMFMGVALGANNEKCKYVGMLINSKNASELTGIYSKLKSDNKEVTEKMERISGRASLKGSFNIQRTHTAGFYAVYTLDMAMEMIKAAKNTISLPMSKLTIACVDYTDGGEESHIELSPDLKAIGRQSGTQISEKVLKAYTESILTALKDIKITK